MAEDLTSDVFHQALRNLGRFEWRGVPFAAWLFRIASNAISDRWQHSTKERGSPTLDEPEGLGNPEDLEDVERRATLFRLVSDLPPDQWRVVQMRFAEEKSIREIAKELRRSEGAVKQLQFRALDNLRKRIGKSKWLSKA